MGGFGIDIWAPVWICFGLYCVFFEHSLSMTVFWFVLMSYFRIYLTFHDDSENDE